MISLKFCLLVPLIYSFLVLRVSGVEILSYEVVATYSHDSKAWTQGLYYENGTLYESTGLYGESTLRRVDLKTGKVLQQTEMNATYFAEGLTLFQGQLYQLTWQAGRGFIYDATSFQRVGSFRYKGEGWGLAHDGAHLIISDGTDEIRFLDPKTFEVVRTIEVKLSGKSLRYLNELEYVDGYIYANVWYEEVIVKIDPNNGDVVGLVDLSALWAERPRTEGAVLNGIAYLEEQKTFLITGKHWGKLFAIKLSGTAAE